jgi:hypothetical protein
MTAPSVPRTPLTDWRAPVPPKRRRFRRWLWFAVTAAVLALAGRGVYVWQAVNADTLEVDNLNVFRAQPADKTGIETIHNGLGDDYVVDYHRAGTFLVDLRVANTGKRAVRIERVPEERYYYFKIDHVLVGTDKHGMWSGHFELFRPFTLRPGEARRLEVWFRFPDCDLVNGDGILTRVKTLPVGYRILGQSRAAYVEFDREMLTVKAGGGCDRPFPRG